jgi:hypothetical protein
MFEDDFLKGVEKKYHYQKYKKKLGSAANVLWEYDSLLRFLAMLVYFFGYVDSTFKTSNKTELTVVDVGAGLMPYLHPLLTFLKHPYRKDIKVNLLALEPEDHKIELTKLQIDELGIDDSVITLSGKRGESIDKVCEEHGIDNIDVLFSFNFRHTESVEEGLQRGKKIKNNLLFVFVAVFSEFDHAQVVEDAKKLKTYFPEHMKKYINSLESFEELNTSIGIFKKHELTPSRLLNLIKSTFGDDSETVFSNQNPYPPSKGNSLVAAGHRHVTLLAPKKQK